MVCCLKGIWVHPYTIPPSKLAPDFDFGVQVQLWSKLMFLHHYWGQHPPQTAFHIRIRYITSVWAIGMLPQRHMGASLYRYTRQGGPSLEIQRVRCGVRMMTLVYHGWGWQYPGWTTLIISIRYIKSVWAIDMLSQGHMGAPLYRYTSQVGPRFGDYRPLFNCKNDAITSQLRLLTTSVCYPHPY